MKNSGSPFLDSKLNFEPEFHKKFERSPTGRGGGGRGQTERCIRLSVFSGGRASKPKPKECHCPCFCCRRFLLILKLISKTFHFQFFLWGGEGVGGTKPKGSNTFQSGGGEGVEPKPKGIR